VTRAIQKLLWKRVGGMHWRNKTYW
jgi:hypothetical protein